MNVKTEQYLSAYRGRIASPHSLTEFISSLTVLEMKAILRDLMGHPEDLAEVRHEAICWLTAALVLKRGEPQKSKSRFQKLLRK